MKNDKNIKGINNKKLIRTIIKRLFLKMMKRIIRILLLLIKINVKVIIL